MRGGFNCLRWKRRAVFLTSKIRPENRIRKYVQFPKIELQQEVIKKARRSQGNGKNKKPDTRNTFLVVLRSVISRTNKP